MTGVSWRAPPPAPAGPALRRPVARGGRPGAGGAGQALGGGGGCRPSAWGGGGARSRSRIAGSGGRASLRPAATGRVDGGGPMKTNEGSGSIYLHVRHIALKIKMRVCKYYYSNDVLE